MNRTRARGRQTDSRLAGEFGVSAGHERRHLLVTSLDELDLLRAIQGAEDPVDPVARVPINAVHPPSSEPLNDEVAYQFAHDPPLALSPRDSDGDVENERRLIVGPIAVVSASRGRRAVSRADRLAEPERCGLGPPARAYSIQSLVFLAASHSRVSVPNSVRVPAVFDLNSDGVQLSSATHAVQLAPVLSR